MHKLFDKNTVKVSCSCMKFKQVLIKTCKEKTVNLSFMCICIFFIFLLKTTNISCLFFYKNDIICLIIAFACLHETQSCMDI